TAFINIDDTKSFNVFGLQRLNQSRNALADLLCHFRFRDLLSDDVFAPGFQSPFRGGAVSVVINGGVAKNSIEPRHSALFVAYLRASLQTTDESRLQNVFSNLS